MRESYTHAQGYRMDKARSGVRSVTNLVTMCWTRAEEQHGGAVSASHVLGQKLMVWPSIVGSTPDLPRIYIGSGCHVGRQQAPPSPHTG